MTNYTEDNDKLYRYLFKDRGVRGEWVRLNKTFNETLATHHYPQPVQTLLGEMMVATALLTATLKFKGNITMQLQGNGALQLAVVNANDQQQMRAVARVQGEIQENMSLREMLGEGVMVMTIAPEKGERYQGVVALDHATLTACLESYFQRSEQLATKLVIATGEIAGEAVSAGLLLQVMPDGTGTENDFEHLSMLATTATKTEFFTLTAKALLYRLFHEEYVEIYPAQSLHFYCGCSETRSAHALLMLGQPELNEIFTENQGVIETCCECCGKKYCFTPESLAKMNN